MGPFPHNALDRKLQKTILPVPMGLLSLIYGPHSGPSAVGFY